jgi:ABC-type bacteriocin/lantibiotic exporter with double-glycine peptidase domain
VGKQRRMLTRIRKNLPLISLHILAVFIACLELLNVVVLAILTSKLINIPIPLLPTLQINSSWLLGAIVIRFILTATMNYFLNLLTLRIFNDRIKSTIEYDCSVMFKNYKNESEIDSKYGVSRWGYINTFLIPRNTLFIEIYVVLIIVIFFIYVFGFSILVTFIFFGITMAFMYFGLRKISLTVAAWRVEYEQNMTQYLREVFGLRYFYYLNSLQFRLRHSLAGTLNKLARITASEHLIINLPRLTLEFVVAIIMLAVLTTASLDISSNNWLIFLVSAMRLLPSAVRVSGAIQSLTLSTQYRQLYNERYGDPENSSVSLCKHNAGYRIQLQDYKYFNRKIELLADIEGGDALLIDGKSGAGKSQLVDQIIYYMRGDNNISYGIMLQDTYVFKGSIIDNILIGRVFEATKIKDVLSISGLDVEYDEYELIRSRDFNKNADKLSGGQKKRLGLARALYDNPDILFLDEPTAGLDNEAVDRFVELLGQVQNVIIITHDPKVKELATNRILLCRETADVRFINVY